MDEALGIVSNNENTREKNTYSTHEHTTTNDKNTTTHSAKSQMEAGTAIPISIENLHNYIRLKPKNNDKQSGNDSLTYSLTYSLTHSILFSINKEVRQEQSSEWRRHRVDEWLRRSNR